MRGSMPSWRSRKSVKVPPTSTPRIEPSESARFRESGTRARGSGVAADELQRDGLVEAAGPVAGEIERHIEVAAGFDSLDRRAAQVFLHQQAHAGRVGLDSRNFAVMADPKLAQAQLAERLLCTADLLQRLKGYRSSIGNA